MEAVYILYGQVLRPAQSSTRENFLKLYF